MKKFTWRLQRLLDIKERQESSLRNELMRVTEEAGLKKEDIKFQKEKLHKALCAEADNFVERELLLRYSASNDEVIKRLERQLRELEKEQEQKKEELLELRRFKEGLEKLRAKAKEEFEAEQQKIEQGQLDENNTIAFARKAMAQQGYAGCR